MHDRRIGWIRVIKAVNVEPVPNRTQRAEMLVPEEPVPAVYPFGLGGGVDDFKIVSGFGMAIGKYRTPRDLLQNPNLALIAPAPQIGGDAGRDQMHVYAESGWRGSPRQPALLGANFGESQAEAAELPRHRRKQVLGFAKLVEIFGKKTCFLDRSPPR